MPYLYRDVQIEAATYATRDRMKDKRLQAIVLYTTPSGQRRAVIASPIQKTWTSISRKQAAQLLASGKALLWDSKKEAIENHFLPFNKGASERAGCSHVWFKIQFMPKFQKQWKRAWFNKCVKCGAFAR